MIENEVDIELDKLLRRHKKQDRSKKNIQKETEVNESAYNQDLDKFLNINESGEKKRSKETIREYRVSNGQKITLDSIQAKQKNILSGTKLHKDEKKNPNIGAGLELLINKKGKDGTQSIIDIKLPSEIVKEQASQGDPDPERDARIKEDLIKLGDSHKLSSIVEESLVDQNKSTFLVLKLLKKRGIVGGNKANGIYGNVSRKERNERFLESEKRRVTDDAGKEFYQKFLNAQVSINSNKEALQFDKEEFLRKKRPIKLDYRDKKGRVLTRKQAFNEQCLKFHGVKRSVTKEERLRKKREKIRNEQTKTDSLALPSFFKAANRITNKPFINLNKDLN